MEEVPESFRSLLDLYKKTVVERDTLIVEVETLKLLNKRMDRALCENCDGTGREIWRGVDTGPCEECGY